MKFIYKILILILLLNFNYLEAQKSVPISELETKLNQNPNYIIIELYTGWCGICAIQDKKIQKSDELVSLLENEFYFVKFDAESDETFVLNEMKFEKKNKIHEFARGVFPDSNSFPAWVIMNSDFEIIFQYNGLIEVEDLKAILLKLNNLD